MYIFYLEASLVESHFNLKAEKCVLKEMKELYIIILNANGFICFVSSGSKFEVPALKKKLSNMP